ncbi:hypothetical protein GCM10012275_55890 [Longimycelium tulufanense]|uniref:DUF881 domain-containing protein n=1 Tax=Longimycelium tulufanense TaxID=907463 RepID=A0A8J3CKP6_9PSEU|nr:DUF881 domain-containing protein [Longimycelium tulufanense]GGM78062.1 hypothetical protein GCM10012275_55890 [Longimycelium tulufanense]
MRRLSQQPGASLGWWVAAPALCLLAGVLFAVTHNTADGYDLRGGRTTELSGLVRDADARVGAAEHHLADLRAQLREAESAAGGSDQRVRDLQQRADKLGPAAGLTGLAGGGLTVTLTDAPRGPDGRYPAGANPNDLVVHQQDLQSVLNALWTGGAEAVSVADQRLVSTSAPRCVGNTLLLHGRTYSPPYVIRAIGDPDRMAAALDAEPGVRVFRQYVQTFGLGYRVERSDDIRVPGYPGTPRLDNAQEVPR